MILCYLYCLCNDIDFVLFDSNHRFSESHDLLDFFEPFCITDNHVFNRKYNKRDFFGEMGWRTMLKDFFSKTEPSNEIPIKRMKHRLVGDFYKKLYGFDYYTYELFSSARDRRLEQKHFIHKEMGIDGDLQDSCKSIIDKLWVYKPNVQAEVMQYISSISMPNEYLGVHIRRGDKVMEYDMQDIKKYMTLLEQHSSLRVAFVLTDDYRTFLDLEKEYPDWEFHTLCEKSECGYYHDEFMKGMSIENITRRHIKLFASMDILSQSQLFVGSYSSNPGMYLGMRMGKGKVLGVDFENWRIW